MDELIVGISGASGVKLALRTIEHLLAQGLRLHVVVSRAAVLTASCELEGERAQLLSYLRKLPGKLTLYQNNDLAAPIASGSYPTRGMVVIPCSMASLAAIALGLGDNLLRRAADVCLKEKRRLVVVPREMPLHEVHLTHMTKIAKMGAIVAPPVPGWYTKPQSVEDIEDFIVGRVLTLLGLDVGLTEKWQGQHGPTEKVAL